MRGATLSVTSLVRRVYYFNPRTPCGVRRENLIKRKEKTIFQSTHPMRGATLGKKIFRDGKLISIHAPHAGCDCGFIQKNKRFSDIPLFFSFAAPFRPHIGRENRRSSRIFGARLPSGPSNKPQTRRRPPENARSSPKLRCEPLCGLMNASPSHYRMSGSSGRYACLQPKCSILHSYFFPR